MRRSSRWMAIGAVGSVLLLTAGPASAEETVCQGTIGATTVDNLRVPDGATCRLNGTLVEGTVKVEGDATLKAFGIRVIGNVQAENARKVVVRDRSRVGGSVQIVQGAPQGSSGPASTETSCSMTRTLVSWRTAIGSEATSSRSRTRAG